MTQAKNGRFPTLRKLPLQKWLIIPFKHFGATDTCYLDFFIIPRVTSTSCLHPDITELYETTPSEERQGEQIFCKIQH